MCADIVKELEPLFNPKSVAHIGATNNRNKWGFSTITSLINTFQGPIYPVNTHENDIQGLKVYRKVTDIAEPVDLAVFTIPAERVAEAMEDCVAKAVKSAVVISAGFAETGPEGKKLQDEVLGIARKGNIRFIGPNCMGYWSASSNLGAFMMPLLVRDGPLAFVSQGGNVGAAVVVAGYERGVGFHRYVSCGCAADIAIEDYIEYFGRDPGVKVIMTYIEGLDDGKRFMEIVKEVTLKKPVIVLKPGKTEAAAKAIKSHSGAMAGSDQIYDAAFKKMGATRVENPEEMLDVAIGFLTQPLPKGRNVAIITPGGSYGVLCAEACEEDHLNVIKLPDKTIQALDKMFPPRWSHGNPVDPAGDRNFIAYLTAPEALLALKEVDSLIFMGFGGFTLFGNLLMQQRSKVEQQQMKPEEITLRDAALRAIIPILENIRSGDVDKTEAGIRTLIQMLGMVLGIKNEMEIEDLAIMTIAARHSGKMDDILIDDLMELASGKALANGSGRSRVEIINDLISRLLRALVSQWIESWGKPVITTTFTEEQVKLIGDHYDYTSGKRAARVLVKLTEYYSYLHNIGAV
ncbi:MAG: CoA-binding protein [Dehalococcoidia bacterium]|nr:CoA-binding protein [Dehalococcoidia bacterium]